jgi:hypothetical protein
MTFFVAQRVNGGTNFCGRSMLRARRLMKDRLTAWRRLTPQQRANLYVSRMPIAVLAPPNGELSGRVVNR